MLAETSREAAKRFGETPAFVAAGGGWSVSYADLDRLSNEVAAGLARRGVGPGDVVALVLPSIPEYPVAYVALAKLGAITAGVNVRLTPGERAAVLATAEPVLVLTTEDLAAEDEHSSWDLEVVEPAARPDDVLASLRVTDEPPPWPGGDDHPVALVFTSGTTGAPKGAMFCNRQLRAITAIDIGDGWGGGGASVAGTALAHLGFMTKLPGNLRRGSTQHFLQPWRAEEALRLTVAHRMRAVAGVPTQIALMLRLPDLDRHDLSGVQAVVMGGGPATPALIREARERFGAVVLTRYSCTEAGIGIGTAPTDPPEDAEDTVGRPLPGVDLAVLDSDDQPVAAGEVGAVCLRSPAVMTCYWRDPDATSAAFTADGFVRTGDLGFLDDRGRLHLAGRSSERYVRGGYNVHPFEVESVLASHPGVAAVVVVPRPDPVMGEVGVAVVVARSDADAALDVPTLADLRAYAEPRLAHHKLPEDLLLVDALPLTAMEKVDRRALAARAVGQITPRAR
jgi:acyl-CoA synthetase (AMP-forming)/AMP-acid ligase II